jgi:hypothetical protein
MNQITYFFNVVSHFVLSQLKEHCIDNIERYIENKAHYISGISASNLFVSMN